MTEKERKTSVKITAKCDKPSAPFWSVMMRNYDGPREGESLG